MARINNPNGNEVSEIVLPNGNTASKVIAPDGSTVFAAIRDSGINNAIHRWVLNEDSDPFKDRIGNKDGTNNGTTQVTGTWQGDAARDGDGTDDYINLGNLDTFTSGFGSGFGVAFVTQFSETNFSFFMGANASAGANTEVFIGHSNEGANTGVPTFRIGDEDGNVAVVEAGGAINDGNKHTVVIAASDATDVSTYQFYIDGSASTTSTLEDNGLNNNFAAIGQPFYLFARNKGGSSADYLNGVLDDVVASDGDISSTEASDYHAAQPWT
jgi:hypothetical protein